MRCVLEKDGYVTPSVRRREATHDQRYEAVRPKCMWHYAESRLMPGWSPRGLIRLAVERLRSA